MGPVDEPTGNNGPPIEPTTGEWLRALAFVLVVVVLTIGFVIWFAFTFLFKSCCVTP